MRIRTGKQHSSDSARAGNLRACSSTARRSLDWPATPRSPPLLGALDCIRYVQRLPGAATPAIEAPRLAASQLHDADAVRFYLEESFGFRVATPEAALALTP
jgi:hypothetical protein